MKHSALALFLGSALCCCSVSYMIGERYKKNNGILYIFRLF